MREVLCAARGVAQAWLCLFEEAADDEARACFFSAQVGASARDFQLRVELEVLARASAPRRNRMEDNHLQSVFNQRRGERRFALRPPWHDGPSVKRGYFISISPQTGRVRCAVPRLKTGNAVTVKVRVTISGDRVRPRDKHGLTALSARKTGFRWWAQVPAPRAPV